MKIHYLNKNDELLFVSKIVWSVITAITLFALVLPFILSPGQVLALAPECMSRNLYGSECDACGLTTSFIFLSRMEIDRAVESNMLSPWIYGSFLLNVLVYILLLFKSKKFLFRYFRSTMNTQTLEEKTWQI